MSGWLAPLLLDELRLSEGMRSLTLADSNWPNLFPMLTNTVAMAVAWCLTPRHQGASSSRAFLRRLRSPSSASLWLTLSKIAVVDFTSGAMLITGQLAIGSNLFVVLYASCSLWTALFSHFLLVQRGPPPPPPSLSSSTPPLLSSHGPSPLISPLLGMASQRPSSLSSQSLQHCEAPFQEEANARESNNTNDHKGKGVEDKENAKQQQQQQSNSRHQVDVGASSSSRRRGTRRLPLTLVQWVSIVAISGALAADAVISLHHSQLAKQLDDDKGEGGLRGGDGGGVLSSGGENVEHGYAEKEGGAGGEGAASVSLTGVVLVLVGSMLHSLMFVLVESANTHASPLHLHAADDDAASSSVSTIDVCGFMGVTESMLLVAYHVIALLLATSLPTDEPLSSSSSPFMASAATATISTPASDALTHLMVQLAPRYLALVLLQSFHAAAFFTLLEGVGATSSGVLKGLQTVVVFLASGVLFCASDQRECVTSPKAACVTVVSLGLVAYGRSGSRREISEASCGGRAGR
jgi:hypothetical protein